MSNPIVLLLLSLLVVDGQPAPAAANLFSDGSFESGRLRQTVHWRSDSQIDLCDDAFDGRYALLLPAGEPRNVTTVRIPVQAARRYSLRLQAKVDGPGAIALDIEADPDHAVQRLRHTRYMPSWRLQFYDERAESVSRGHPQFFNRIIHPVWTQYREDFYVPPGAAELTVVLSNGTRNSLTVDAIELIELVGPVLNMNPELDFGLTNFSGYNYAHRVHLVAHSDGSGLYLNSQRGWVVGDPIPVTEQRYVVQFRARRGLDNRRAGLRVRYLDADLQDIRDSVVTGITQTDWQQAQYDFVPPEGTRFVRFIIGGGDYDWIRFKQYQADPQ